MIHLKLQKSSKEELYGGSWPFESQKPQSSSFNNEGEQDFYKFSVQVVEEVALQHRIPCRRSPLFYEPDTNECIHDSKCQLFDFWNVFRGLKKGQIQKVKGEWVDLGWCRQPPTSPVLGEVRAYVQL